MLDFRLYPVPASRSCKGKLVLHGPNHDGSFGMGWIATLLARYHLVQSLGEEGFFKVVGINGKPGEGGTLWR